MKLQRISAVTLIIENMKKSCSFYSQMPGFKLVYGGSSDDSFTTFQIGEDVPKMYLNLELNRTNNNHNHGCAAYDDNHRKQRQYFGRMIFHTKDIDGLYSCFSNEHFQYIINK